MAKRRTIQEDDIAAVISIIRAFRKKKPTWHEITKKAKEAGLPFQQRAPQGQPGIKAAYDKKVEAAGKVEQARSERKAQEGLPRSEDDLVTLASRYRRRVEELESELEQRNLELALLTRRCLRNNVELSEINRPLKISMKS